MEYEEVPVALIDEDPKNARQVYKGIEELSEDIAEHGLLTTPVLVRKVDGRYQLDSGHRRLRAVKRLLETERHSGVVFCLVKDHGADTRWTALSTNVHQHELTVWEYGYRFIDLIDAGATQEEIAAHIHKNQSFVSTAVRIARGLHPSVRKRLIHLGQKALTAGQLKELASLYDQELDAPDEGAQLKRLERMLSVKRKRGRPKREPGAMSEKDVVHAR
jgi:ParB/RepB/Spo0J family partition protein